MSGYGFSFAGTSTPARADHYSARQYYGGWHSYHNYYYRSYYYKPYSDYYGYKHHYAIYTPKYPKYVYFYNPYKKQYWGRCPVDHGGKPVYSMLAEKDRKGDLEEIPESAFPAPGPVPPMPESTDGATMELPPDDLPAGENLPNK